MRPVAAVALFLCACALPLQPSIAAAPCGPDKLGVSRTVTIDAVGGPHFATAHKGNKPLLADGEVVLTFDDGPSRTNTRLVLAALAAQCTKATFFMVGQMAIADPAMVQEVARQGHTVGTHTWSHARLSSLSEVKAQDEIELGLSAVQQAMGKPIAPFFRFPYLRDNAFTVSHLQKRQIADFGINIDSRDFEIRNSETLHKRVIADVSAHRRGIILFHDIHISTARAIPAILADIKRLGLRVVHLQPKAGAETLAEYDALARKTLERRHIAVTRNPLSKRAGAWPLAPMPAKTAATTIAAPPPAVEPPAAHATKPEEDWKSRIWDPTH